MLIFQLPDGQFEDNLISIKRLLAVTFFFIVFTCLTVIIATAEKVFITPWA